MHIQIADVFIYMYIIQYVASLHDDKIFILLIAPVRYLFTFLIAREITSLQRAPLRFHQRQDQPVHTCGKLVSVIGVETDSKLFRAAQDVDEGESLLDEMM